MSEIQDEQGIIMGSDEYWRNLNNVLESEIIKGLILYISNTAGEIIDSNGEPIKTGLERNIETIYEEFLTNRCLTPEEQLLLLQTLDDEKAIDIAKNLFSKLILLQGNENKFLFSTYLKDKNGDLDITNFLEYLIGKLENYSNITKTGIRIKLHGEMKGYTFYDFEEDGKKSLFIDKDGQHIYINPNLDNIYITFNEGILGASKINEKGEKVEILCEFDGYNFVEIYSETGIKGFVSSEIDNIYKSFGDNGEGLIEIKKEIDTETKEEKSYVISLLPANNKDITLHPNGFISTTNVEQILDGEEDVENMYRHTIYIKTAGYEGHGEKNHTGILLKPLKQISEIIIDSSILHIEDLGDNYHVIQTLEHSANIYKFLPNELSLKCIMGLEGVSYSKLFEGWGNVLNRVNVLNIKNRLLSGEPSIIEYTDGEKCLCIFDKEKSKLISLVTTTKYDFRYKKLNETVWVIYGGQTIIFYLNEGRVYIFKKGFKYIDGGYIKKTGVTSLLQNKIKIENTFEKMKKYLEEISGPIEID